MAHGGVEEADAGQSDDTRGSVSAVETANEEEADDLMSRDKNKGIYYEKRQEQM